MNYEAKGRERGGKKTIHFNGSDQNAELILLTVISANQLSIQGAEADLCTKVSRDIMASEKPEAHDSLETMEIPTEPPTVDPRTDEQRRGNLLPEYEQQFEQLSENQTMLQRWCKTVERGQYFITLDAEAPSGMVHLCREQTLPRNDPRTQARVWIRRNTKIGPVLNIHVCHHEDRYSIDIQVRSLFQDRTASWVRIVNGVQKYVTETTETIEDEEHRASGKPIAKARPRMKSAKTSTPVSVPLTRRKVDGRQSGKL